MSDNVEIIEYHNLKTGEIWAFSGDEPLAAYEPAPMYDVRLATKRLFNLEPAAPREGE